MITPKNTPTEEKPKDVPVPDEAHLLKTLMGAKDAEIQKLNGRIANLTKTLDQYVERDAHLYTMIKQFEEYLIYAHDWRRTHTTADDSPPAAQPKPTLFQQAVAWVMGIKV